MRERMEALKKRVEQFAHSHVAVRERLSTERDFPRDLWRRMGQEGLLGLSIPVVYGGAGESYRFQVAAMESLVQHGHNMGMALSWMIHLMVGRYFLSGHGLQGAQELFLRPMAEGRLTGSVAISEPGRGAHPKHIRTTARGEEDSFVIDGEKTYLTNGPIADFFIVLAVTGMSGEKKRFTALIVPRQTAGVMIGDPMNLDFLRPSPHCGIRLSNCSVHASNVLGEEGTAFDKLSKPFRSLEDVMLMGQILGGMKWQLELVLGMMRRASVPDMESVQGRLGEILVAIDALELIAQTCAGKLDRGEAPEAIDSLSISFKGQCRHVQSAVRSLIALSGLAEEPDLQVITKDLHHTIHLAAHVMDLKLKKLGNHLLTRERTHETLLR